MSILEKGIDSLQDDVSVAVNRYPEVKAAEKELNDALTRLEELVGYEKFAPVEATISAMRAAEAFASFRVGVTEGLKLANGVRTLIGREGGVPDGS